MSTKNRNAKLGMWTWDFFVFTLVLFPFLTGGLWLNRPGLRIELSELAVPVIGVAFLGAILYRFGHVNLRLTVSARLAEALWRRWQAALKQKPAFTLLIVCGAVALVWALAALRRHWAFGSGAADLGIFTNAIWNLANGHGYVSSVKDGINLFADHQSPLFWVFTPFFKAIPQPEILLVAQSIGLATGGIAIFFLGRQYLMPSAWIPVLPLLYWAYLPIRNANLFDFHPETLMLPLFLWSIVGLQSKAKFAKVFGTMFFLAALAAKESAGPVAVGVGIAWLLGVGPGETRAFTRKVGIASILVGLLVFLFDTRVVPGFFGGKYAYDRNFAYLGSSVSELVAAPFNRPEIFWPHLLGGARLKFLFWTLAPLGFFPLLNWRALVAALPGYLMIFLSDGDHRVSLQYHYGIEPAVGLFWALPGAAIRLSTYLRPNCISMRVVVWTLFWSFAAFGRSEIFQIRKNASTLHGDWLHAQALPCISPKLSMSASGALVPHLATRPWIHHLPRIAMPNEGAVSCVVIDPLVNNWPMSSDEESGLRRRLSDLNFKPLYSCGSFEVLGTASECLKCRPKCNVGTNALIKMTQL